LLLSPSPHLSYNMDKSNQNLEGKSEKLCTFLCTEFFRQLKDLHNEEIILLQKKIKLLETMQY
ncbi:MAG: hypothetical protein ACO23V_12165, partial [Chitinophagaceae bacterium]